MRIEDLVAIAGLLATLAVIYFGLRARKRQEMAEQKIREAGLAKDEADWEHRVAMIRQREGAQ